MPVPAAASQRRDMTTSELAVPTKCLHCKEKLETPIVCTGCHTLYPMPASMDYFELFQIPRRYRIDLADVERKFLAITRNIHPDYFGGSSEDMRSLSVSLSAELNEALRVLKDPVLRAAYLLEEAGGPNAATDRTVPQAVLTNVMMLREEVEEAAGDPETTATVRRKAERKHRQIMEDIADIADRLSEASADEKTRLRHLLNSVRYYDNLLAELPGD
jgi:molecular chaperone HscB